jgi:hypothetical protein
MPNLSALVRRRVGLALVGFLAFGLSASVVQTARAQDDLVIPIPLKRKFPQGVFCTLPVVISFVADGPTATVTYEVNVYTEDVNQPPPFPLVWTQQSIDNAVVATTADYNNNLGPPDGNESWAFCYNGGADPAPPLFYFNRGGLVLPLKELFDSDPTARGWDMSHGAYYVSGPSAPRNPEPPNDPDANGGSLGIGQETQSPSLADRASTSITFGGLTAGTSYTLTTWWNSNNVVPDNGVYLTIHITGSGATPLAKKSWGRVKKAYK